MCLAVPCVIEEIFEDGSARVASCGVETEARLDFIEGAAPGDSVLVHAGFAIQKLDRGESEELMTLWREINARGITAARARA
ncbi:MAG: HypC/HybG/HupF family hydrogenase formation chaperone [Synergistaceae bacterium]|jgi:hydrogenase expression/formation protein HypC|nr:HypC/HybG/HupF family hydrogenase formation chaperone [Synergistaceae bacterium]